jgi:hypothetical protein
MARTKIYNLRLTDEEWARLTAYAKDEQITPAEVLRDYIKRLPTPKATLINHGIQG